LEKTTDRVAERKPEPEPLGRLIAGVSRCGGRV
jgi:hypothetical protein